jgi:hypothetical protein
MEIEVADTRNETAVGCLDVRLAEPLMLSKAMEF